MPSGCPTQILVCAVLTELTGFYIYIYDVKNLGGGYVGKGIWNIEGGNGGGQIKITFCCILKNKNIIIKNLTVALPQLSQSALNYSLYKPVEILVRAF